MSKLNTLTAKCGSCLSRLRVKSHRLEKVVSCPKCGQQITVTESNCPVPPIVVENHAQTRNVVETYTFLVNPVAQDVVDDDAQPRSIHSPEPYTVPSHSMANNANATNEATDSKFIAKKTTNNGFWRRYRRAIGRTFATLIILAITYQFLFSIPTGVVLEYWSHPHANVDDNQLLYAIPKLLAIACLLIGADCCLALLGAEITYITPEGNRLPGLLGYFTLGSLYVFYMSCYFVWLSVAHSFDTYFAVVAVTLYIVILAVVVLGTLVFLTACFEKE